MREDDALKKRENYAIGFSMIDIIATLVIISIILAIATPRYVCCREHAKEKVCKINRRNIVKGYEIHLEINNLEHSEEFFNQYIDGYDKELCPCGGTYSYIEGEIRCSIHCDDEDVPYLRVDWMVGAR